MDKFKIVIIMRIALLSFMALVSLNLKAQSLTIAVAANGQAVLEQLVADFQKEYHIKANLIVNSSGVLAAQIVNGAPYDLFLSADMKTPIYLFKQGFGLRAPIEYARGSLVICSIHQKYLSSWQKDIVLLTKGKVALANPQLAPYGKAAVESLQYFKIWTKLMPRIIYGSSIAQVNAYISEGAVEFGFSSRSFIEEMHLKHKPIYFYTINSKSYTAIRQGMLLLKHSQNSHRDDAVKFYSYLSSKAAKITFEKFGYTVCQN